MRPCFGLSEIGKTWSEVSETRHGVILARKGPPFRISNGGLVACLPRPMMGSESPPTWRRKAALGRLQGLVLGVGGNSGCQP